MAQPKRSDTARHAAKIAQEGREVRSRIRDLTARTIRERSISGDELSGLVGDVLRGTREGLKAALPASEKSVLRQVFEGLSDASAAGWAGASGAAAEARKRAVRLKNEDLPKAAHHATLAKEHFLDAVSGAATHFGAEAREELRSLVARARRTGRQVAKPAKEAAQAARGRVGELAGETASSGLRVARDAATKFMMSASGMLEGLADALTGAAAKTKGKPAKPRAKKKAAKRTRKSAARSSPASRGTR